MSLEFIRINRIYYSDEISVGGGNALYALLYQTRQYNKEASRGEGGNRF